MSWIKCSERLPEGRVLAFYHNENGKPRIEVARYFFARTEKCEDWFEGDPIDYGEYDAENDIWWVPEGWWEDSWESESSWAISSNVTHWMPLPEPPKED